ncbi:MAG: TonB-dependent receptor [Bacteroidota bacterium]|nr:TonB-dependent receptor [Bacteroidota bacterium]
MNSHKKILFLFILFLFSNHLLSQSVSGLVYEKADNGSRSPLPGANVFWIGTTKGTYTDSKGKFTISRQGISDNRLVVSLIGYEKDTIDSPANRSRLEILLKKGNQALSEVEIKDKKDDSFISKLNARQTQVINVGELQRAACCNLAESFETNASVDVSYSDAVTGAKQIQLLGLSGIYSQIMTENIPLIRGLASTFGLNYIPGSWMESIQISKGTASVVNGYESTTGQINVEYKKPENDEKLYINVFGNSNARLEGNADASLKLNDKLSTMILLHGDYFNSKFDKNKDGFMDLPRLKSINLFNRWDYINPGKMVSKFGIKILDEDRSGGQMSFDPEHQESDTTGISTGNKPYGFGIHTRRMEGFWKNGFFIPNHPETSIGLIISAINHEQHGFYGINQYSGHEQTLYANLILTTSFLNNKHKISAGMSYMLDSYHEHYLQNQLQYDYQVFGGNSDTSLFILYKDNKKDFVMNRTEWVPGAFFEYTLNLWNKVTVIAGLRGDYDNLWGFFMTPRMHVHYKINETTSFRASAGMGYRTANILAENSSWFLSQRTFVISDDLKQEKAWNYGINFTKEFKAFQNKATLEMDVYQTRFLNQVVVDADSLAGSLLFYNLNGKSFATSYQVQVIMEPVKRFNVTLAFRINDVKMDIGGELREKPFVNLYKGLITLSYATKFERWKFDLTSQFNGPSRLPDSKKMPSEFQQPAHSPFYIQLLGQVTRKYKYFELYIGGENLTNYTQDARIIESQYPYHTHFDASMIWGPVTGVDIYAGVRFILK